MKYNKEYCTYCGEYIGYYTKSHLCNICEEFPGEFTDKCLQLEGPYFLIFKAIMFFGKKCLEKLTEQHEFNKEKFQNIENLFDERLPGRKRDY